MVSNSVTMATAHEDEKPSNKTSLDRSASQNGSTREATVPNQSVPEQDLEKSKTPAAPVIGGVNPADFPDGGLEAWLVVFGGFCCLFCKFPYTQNSKCMLISNKRLFWVDQCRRLIPMSRVMTQAMS